MDTNTNTNNSVIIIILAIVILVGAFFTYKEVSERMALQNEEAIITENSQNSQDAAYKNIAYNIGNQSVKLTDGLSEVEAAPGSASKITTKFFGNEVLKDLNNDGRPDVAFLVIQDGGGSGTFFYVVAALNTEDGYIGSKAILIGDRITPQTTESGPDNSIIVNYLDRAVGQPMSEKPTVAKSIQLVLDPTTLQFSEVAQNFEEEANPDQMNLNIKTWKWFKTEPKSGKDIRPKKDVFTLTFNKDGSFSATTDCNGISGKYTAKDSKLTFSNTASTLMYCDGSQETELNSIIINAQNYKFTSAGELVLDLKANGGSAYFK